MKNAQSLLNRLEAQVRADIDAQVRIQAQLDTLHVAVRSGSPSEIEAHFEALKAEATAGSERSAKRGLLFQALAAHYGVPATMVTLSSIAERVGPGGERLRELRAELRTATSLVVRMHRKLAASIRCQRRIHSDALAILLSGTDGTRGNPLIEEGTLVDARV
jgi:hypothetical protein